MKTRVKFLRDDRKRERDRKKLTQDERDKKMLTAESVSLNWREN